MMKPIWFFGFMALGIATAFAEPSDHSALHAQVPIGNIESVVQLDDGTLKIEGWALDNEVGSVRVISLYGSEIIFETQTKGSREDVTKAHPEKKTADVVVSGQTKGGIKCVPNSRVISLAISANRQVAVIGNNALEACASP